MRGIGWDGGNVLRLIGMTQPLSVKCAWLSFRGQAALAGFATAKPRAAIAFATAPQGRASRKNRGLLAGLKRTEHSQFVLTTASGSGAQGPLSASVI